jgi:2-polyprenyl-3-methyl-5-hydroxy-6-metoxy-1,4-benzoquinol methylase
MGDLSGELLSYGSVTGIDLSEEGIQIAKRRFPGGEFFAANMLEHDFGSRQFDLVVSSEVLEHVPREAQLTLFHQEAH